MSEVHRLFPENADSQAFQPQVTVEDAEVAQLARHTGEHMPEIRQHIAALLFSTLSNEAVADAIRKLSFGVATQEVSTKTVTNPRNFTPDQTVIG